MVFGGSAPELMEFIALLTTGRQEKRAEADPALPRRAVTWVGGQVSLQRCPILRTGRDIIQD